MKKYILFVHRKCRIYTENHLIKQNELTIFLTIILKNGVFLLTKRNKKQFYIEQAEILVIVCII